MFRQEDEQLYWMAQVVGNASWRPALWETKRVTGGQASGRPGWLAAAAPCCALPLALCSTL